ncbi:MAG: non-heme iron oxygenase ferredoxin subunit [Candidatus Glassbacteria bacterium]|nr:non-heme iron oxygenase ferredoxin subunit [Candidatus Glassbacteria bacterium]
MSFLRAAGDKEVKPGQALRVELDGRLIALVRTADGRLFAVDDTCTHEQESLSDGFVEEGWIECPRHGAQFDLESGRALTLPALEKLGTYEVKVEIGEIMVNIT